MPIGSYSSIPYLASHLLKKRPATVLDLGMGFGMTGAVVRQWLDGGIEPFKTTLVGVEVWPEYRSVLWDLYDSVYVDTIQQFLATSNTRFDLIVMGDVLEHFHFPAGEIVIQQAQMKLKPSGYLFVATPAEPMPQGPVYGNRHEEHRSHWRPADLARRGFEILLSADESQLEPAVATLIARWQRPE